MLLQVNLTVLEGDAGDLYNLHQVNFIFYILSKHDMSLAKICRLRQREGKATSKLVNQFISATLHNLTKTQKYVSIIAYF